MKKGTAPSFAVHWTPGPPCTVMGGAGQLLQVAMNLVQNAVDAAAGRLSAANADEGGAVFTLELPCLPAR